MIRDHVTRINRRRFLEAAGTGLALASTRSSVSLAQGPAVGVGAPDVVVIGAGAFGAWTALVLRERGA